MKCNERHSERRAFLKLIREIRKKKWVINGNKRWPMMAPFLDRFTMFHLESLDRGLGRSNGRLIFWQEEVFLEPRTATAATAVIVRAKSHSASETLSG